MKLCCMKKPLYLVQLALIAIWITNLIGTQGFFLTYALCAAAAVACLLDNYNHGWKLTKWGTVLYGALAMLFGGAVALSNYAVFGIVRDPEAVSYSINKLLNLCNAGLTVLGGAVAAWHVLCWIHTRLPQKQIVDPAERKHPWLVFWGSFALIVVIDLVYHYTAVYPGTLSKDSMDQVIQTYTGVYSNHHPFWHTMVIQLCLRVGMAVFGDINMAVSLYFVLQTVLMAASFGYVTMTLYQLGVPKLWIGVTLALYALMPYNIAYSSTMWKDVLFGGTVVAFLTAMLRILRKTGKKQIWNYVIFAVSGIGFCVWRSNGFLAILASFLVFSLVLFKDHKKLLLVLLGVIVTGWVMKGPVLNTLNVTDPDLVESLSIPVQQVARVIADGGELTTQEAELLDKVVDLDKVPELYDYDLSDPIKNEIRRKNNAYFEENIGQYLQIWLQLLKRYPVEYVKAWVDQTRGYWGGGYSNWIFGEFIVENDYGIFSAEQSGILFKINRMYFGLIRNFELFQPLHSIGLHTWLLAIFCAVNLLKRRREWLLSVPLLMIILTLMVATPVAAEFRYAYAIFTSFPLVACASVFVKEKA